MYAQRGNGYNDHYHYNYNDSDNNISTTTTSVSTSRASAAAAAAISSSSSSSSHRRRLTCDHWYDSNVVDCDAPEQATRAFVFENVCHQNHEVAARAPRTSRHRPRRLPTCRSTLEVVLVKAFTSPALGSQLFFTGEQLL